jgi:hypothetical protein
MMSAATFPDPEAVRDGIRALSSLMMAAAFVIEPEVWPGFAAYVERITGKDLIAGPETMDVSIQIGDAMRAILAQTIGQDPGHRYPSST